MFPKFFHYSSSFLLKEDDDVDNDGDVDKTDDYLKNRRKAISKAIKDKDKDKIKEMIKDPSFLKDLEEIAPALAGLARVAAASAGAAAGRRAVDKVSSALSRKEEE